MTSAALLGDGSVFLAKKAALPLWERACQNVNLICFGAIVTRNKPGGRRLRCGIKKPALNAGVFDQLERAKRFELSTLTLARLCSTPELRPHPFGEAEIAPVAVSCKG